MKTQKKAMILLQGYLQLKTGATPLSNRAINYVSSNNEIGFNSPSPYTKNQSIMF